MGFRTIQSYTAVWVLRVQLHCRCQVVSKAAHQQERPQCVLPSSPSTTDWSTCWRRSYSSAGTSIRHIPAWLLQRSVSGSTRNHDPTLQHVQNAAAWLIFGLRTSDHITPSLIQLHWLPIRWRIQYKLRLLVHSVHSARSLAYLADIVEPASSRYTRRLRSTESSLYEIPRLRTKFGERAFSFSGPSAWNALLADIRDETSTATFRTKPKTFYFSLAFDCAWQLLAIILRVSKLTV